MVGERSASRSAAADPGRGSTSSVPGDAAARASGASGPAGRSGSAGPTGPSGHPGSTPAAAETRSPRGQLQRLPSGAFPAVARQPQPSPRTTCGGLLNQLRAMVAKPVPVVVIAGASDGGAAYRITEGLADAARRTGLRLLVEELIGPAGRPLLQQRASSGYGRAALADRAGRDAGGGGDDSGAGRAAGGDSGGWRAANEDSGAGHAGGGDGAGRAAGGGDGAGSTAGDERGGGGERMAGDDASGAEREARERGASGGNGSGPRPRRTASGIVALPQRGGAGAGALEPVSGGSTLTRWFEQSSGGVDFIAIAAPPLDSSVEAALLARACDGLVIVVESEVTPRESLHRAVRLARASGCRLLGLVMSEPKARLPSWWRRLISASTYRGRP
jgi:hypothetical protein